MSWHHRMPFGYWTSSRTSLSDLRTKNSFHLHYTKPNSIFTLFAKVTSPMMSTSRGSKTLSMSQPPIMAICMTLPFWKLLLNDSILGLHIQLLLQPRNGLSMKECISSTLQLCSLLNWTVINMENYPKSLKMISPKGTMITLQIWYPLFI